MDATFKDTPVYPHTAAHARNHEELAVFRESQRANIACKEAIEQVVHAHYASNSLDSQAAIAELRTAFSMDRIQYVLANTVQQKDWDGRISADNKAWAATVPVAENMDSWGGNRNCYFVVDQLHPGILDLFVTHFRKERAKEPQVRKTSILDKLQKPLPDVPATPGKAKMQEL